MEAKSAKLLEAVVNMGRQWYS